MTHFSYFLDGSLYLSVYIQICTRMVYILGFEHSVREAGS